MKPRIVYTRWAGWVCTGHGQSGWGPSPLRAYERWLALTAESNRRMRRRQFFLKLDPNFPQGW